MTQLEFCQEKSDHVFAHITARDQTAIPTVGDHVYVPDSKNTGVYAYAKVVSRQFYYSQAGDLTMIRLSCEILV
jgi:hypothetical protein